MGDIVESITGPRGLLCWPQTFGDPLVVENVPMIASVGHQELAAICRVDTARGAVGPRVVR